MMSDQQWQYCELALDDYKFHEGGFFKGKGGYGYSCYVRYCGANGDIKEQLSDLKTITEIDLFGKALGRLGALGWELVSIQHSPGGGGNGDSIYMSFSIRVAYFKRPVVAGRAVNEPKLIV